MGRIVLVTITLVIAASEARAQRAPDMATLDRGDGISKIGLDLAFSAIDTPFYDAALRFDLHGQYVTQSGFGIYGGVPFAKSFGDGEDDNPDPDILPDPAFAIGNLELGGLFVITNSPKVSWVFRLGVALPTASDGRDGATTNYFATWPRLTDLALAVPDTTYLRFSFSPLIHVNNFFFQADLGFDFGFDENDDLFRLNVGAGFDIGVVALSVELVNLANFDGLTDDEDDDFANTVAFTLRFMGEQYQPYLSLGTPIDNSRDDVEFFFAGGIQVVP